MTFGHEAITLAWIAQAEGAWNAAQREYRARRWFTPSTNMLSLPSLVLGMVLTSVGKVILLGPVNRLGTHGHDFFFLGR